jgi:hypothetical protein
VIVGRPTPYVIGTCTSIDVCGDYIPDLWDEDGEINLTMNAAAGLDTNSLEILGRAPVYSRERRRRR